MSRPPRLPGIDDDSAKRVLILLGANRNGLTINELDTHVDTIAWLLARGLVQSPELDAVRHLEKIPDHVIRRMKWCPTQKAIDMVEAYERSVWPEFVATDDEHDNVPTWDYWLNKKGVWDQLTDAERDVLWSLIEVRMLGDGRGRSAEELASHLDPIQSLLKRNLIRPADGVPPSAWGSPHNVRWAAKNNAVIALRRHFDDD